MKPPYPEDDYRQFLCYKYFDKKYKPGILVDETLAKSQMLINAINDDSSDQISIDFKDTPEDSNIERLFSLTFKDIELLMRRMKYDKENVPDSIKKAKQDAYNKVFLLLLRGCEKTATDHENVH